MTNIKNTKKQPINPKLRAANKRINSLEITVTNQQNKIDYLQRKNEELYKSISLRDDILKQHGLTDIEKVFLKTLRQVFTEKS